MEQVAPEIFVRCLLQLREGASSVSGSEGWDMVGHGGTSLVCRLRVLASVGQCTDFLRKGGDAKQQKQRRRPVAFKCPEVCLAVQLIAANTHQYT